MAVFKWERYGSFFLFCLSSSLMSTHKESNEHLREALEFLVGTILYLEI